MVDVRLFCVSFFYVWLLQTISLAFVFQYEEQGYDNGNGSKSSKDSHSLCVIYYAVSLCVGLVYLANPNGYECQPNVLNVKNECVGSTEQFHWYDTGYRRPHG